MAPSTAGGDSLCATWEFVFPDHEYRLEMEGQAVRVGDPILLRNCSSNQCLATAEKHVVRTDFGVGTEIFAKTMLTSHKAEGPENVWVPKMSAD